MSILRLTVAIVAAALVAPLSMVSAKGHADPSAKYRIDTHKLPNIDHALTALPQWSGQMPVGANNTLFFWYTQAANVKSDNLIFWHNGGPGCSSLEGLFGELGPYQSSDNGRNWHMNPHSWHNLGHVVFIDQPFGTGFSSNQTTVPTEDFIGDTMVQFYQNFFKAFPEMQSKKMYLTGESYAGRYIPYMAKHVLSHNKAVKHSKDKINLKAVAIGDGYIDTSIQNDFIGLFPYFQEHPWMAGNNKTWFAEAEKLVAQAIKMPGCADAKFEKDITPECRNLENKFYADMSNPVNFPLSVNCTNQNQPAYFDPYNIAVKDCNLALGDLNAIQLPWEYYLNLPGMQDTLHVGPNIKYADCGGNKKGIYRDDPSMAPKYFIGDLVDQGVKVTLYTGLLDSVCPHTLTENSLRVMKWKGHKGFQHSKMTPATMTPIKIAGNKRKNIGTYHSERDLSYVVFNNAGHMVPRDEPVGSYWMMEQIVLHK